MKRPGLLFTALLLTATVQAAPLQWADIRDGSLYLQAAKADTLKISWQPAWQADANAERLYLLDGQGHLQAERAIPAAETRGQVQWPLAASSNDYQLEIPGYSFRRYRIEHADSTRALLAPAKVHFSAEVGPHVELYFRVPANQQATLAGKYHGGVHGLQVQRLGDGRQLNLALKPYPAYWQFDRLALPLASSEQTYRLRLLGRGKVAFWLDGSANLFAQQAQHLGPLHNAEGQVSLRLGERVLGPTPSLGVNLPYVLPPPSSYAVLDALQPQAAGYYSFSDLLARKPGYEDAFRRFYQQRYRIKQDITLLGGTARQSVLAADRTSNDGLDAWLSSTRALPGDTLHYLAFADEPNLFYPDYPSFSSYFQHMLERVQRFPGAREAGVRIAVPASSRLVNGPLHADSRARIGLDWARRLLKEHGGQIDALAWHEWMIRDLLATRSYRDSVRQAAELVGLDAQGRPNKALLLDQTNLSSGSSLSPYDQDTHFAALWWTSVVINASQDGLLDMLNWFHVADEPEWPKGMVRVLGEDRFELKPVGLAQQFIQQHWLDQVLTLDNDAFEVDALAMARGKQRSLLGVNKGERLQHISLATQQACPQGALSLFGPDNQARAMPFACEQGRIHFQLPGQTLFALTWSAS
ncbi:hypothetical protein [Pseudomonas rubra]|uniref:Uncharacterized protein n=1 Tax=Pseudomonas rubra TaxID=2942627 RepID=A0ABT5PBD9_9PSED|nr:hypothetical protein [Pseudomonas rubra]MDD1015624.1 hypothetical protein [Pseudomonas rubra]MDD1040975.1 hypothetical protein [Pseudomonas rubra]MDD1154824.1 hypothetical protein [Pseudomonas rubra]